MVTPQVTEFTERMRGAEVEKAHLESEIQVGGGDLGMAGRSLGLLLRSYPVCTKQGSTALAAASQQQQQASSMVQSASRTATLVLPRRRCVARARSGGRRLIGK